jgi:hypothetical protein
MKITFDERTFRLIFLVSFVALAFGIACAILSTIFLSPISGNIITLTVDGTGSGSVLHEGTKLGDELGFYNSTVKYNYAKNWGNGEKDPETQESEVTLTGADGGYWNKYITRTTTDVAGHEVVNRVSSIEGSFYGKSGMDVSYSESNGAEQLNSSIIVDSKSGNATYHFDVTRWDGNTFKPATMHDLQLSGSLFIDQFVQLIEPITTQHGWLDFCESINRDVIKSDESGLYVLPPGYGVDSQGKLFRIEMNASSEGEGPPSPPRAEGV